MGNHLAQVLMDEFADATGVSGNAKPRRYLWTDAFAVCNFLGLYTQTSDNRYLQYARELVEQVHHVLGRHRDDDPRRGWISGLSDHDGEEHPTIGGLRIGKPLNERKPHETPNAHLEWDQDGQYFHYLTKWMHALNCMGRETGESRYQRWAVDLAVTTHKAFTREISPGGPKRIAWKLSIDRSRPLVSSMGQHDPLDGLITFLELQANPGIDAEVRGDLAVAISDFTEMCANARWATEDPLGIGGLLDNATRLSQLIRQNSVSRREFLRELLIEAELSLKIFSRSSLLRRPANQRLPFRELGLSIGLHGLERMSRSSDLDLAAAYDCVLPYKPLAGQIEAFWSDSEHRLGTTWTDHRDINAVMLATSLMPEA